MKKSFAALLLSLSFASGAWSATTASPGSDPVCANGEQARIEQMSRQLELLTDEISKLRTEVARPKTKAEAFAFCMQATKTASSAMAAESIGEHCDRLLKD